MNKKRIIRIGKILFSAGIIVILLLYTDINEFKNVLSRVNGLYYFVASLFILSTLIIGIIRWKILLDGYNYRSEYFLLTKYFLLSNFYNIFIPGGVAGDVVRGYKLSDENLNKKKSYAIIFVDRFIALLGFFIIGSVSLFYIYANKNNSKISLILAIIYVIFIIFSVLIFSNIFVKVFSFFNYGLFNRIKYLFVEIKEYKKNRKLLIKSLIISILAASFNILAFYFTGLSLNINLSLFPYIIVVPLVIILKLVPFTYEGLGLREAAMILVFSDYGLTNGESMAISLVYFSNILIMAFLSGIISIVIRKDDDIKFV